MVAGTILAMRAAVHKLGRTLRVVHHSGFARTTPERATLRSPRPLSLGQHNVIQQHLLPVNSLDEVIEHAEVAVRFPNIVLRMPERPFGLELRSEKNIDNVVGQVALLEIAMSGPPGIGRLCYASPTSQKVSFGSVIRRQLLQSSPRATVGNSC
jgi:hypothetical protein